MSDPASRRIARTFAVSATPVVVLVLGAAALLPSARAEEALPPDALAPPPSKTAPSAPSASSAARDETSGGGSAKGASGDDLKRAEQDLRSIFDPTVIRRRVGIEDELIDLEDTAWTNRTELSGIWAIGPAENFDVGLGLVLPVVYYASEEPPGRDDAFGLGDVELSSGIALKHASWFAHAAALEVKFNTSTDDFLGGNATNLKPYYLASLRPFSFLGSVLEVDYNDSVDEESGVGKTQNLELNPSVNLTYPEQWLWFARVQYKGKVDFENDNDYTNRMEVSLGKIVGDAKQVSLFWALEFPLDDKTDQFSGKIGITYFFD